MLEYTTNALVPGRLFFRCERMRGTLSTTACADMWRKANDMNDGSCASCMRCPIGAVHAGEVAASMSPLKGTLTCARCHRGATRLIHKHLCVSCQNRAYEVEKGRNAKGTAPVKHTNLVPRRIRYMHGEELRTLAMRQTADTDELIVAVLRDSKKSVAFAFNPAPPSAVRQMRLW